MRALGASRTSLVPGGVLAGPWVRDDLWRRARAVPSLDLRFADNKSLTDAVTGASLVTFTRASNGTYTDSAGVLQTAATDVPRFDHNPITGESLGLLVEEQRANLLQRSEEFGTLPWATTNASITANSIAAPNGTVTADTLVEDSSSSTHPVLQAFNVTAGVTYTLNCYVKAAGRNFTQLLFIGGFASNITAIFSLADGSVGSTGGTPVTTAVNAGNGWYRVSITATATTTTTTSIQFRPAISSSAANYQGDGTSGIYLWGAQLEAGAFPTSYIPTTTAAATRNADVASITGSAFFGWYRQDEGTVFAECAVAEPVSGGNQFVFRANDNTFSNQAALNIQSLGFASIATAAGGVFDGVAASALALSANTAAKFAGAYAVNNLGMSLNGATAVTDTSATMPTALTRADIGSDHIGANRVKAGTIRRLTYWPQRLANSTLQNITS